MRVKMSLEYWQLVHRFCWQACGQPAGMTHKRLTRKGKDGGSPKAATPFWKKAGSPRLARQDAPCGRGQRSPRRRVLQAASARRASANRFVQQRNQHVRLRGFRHEMLKALADAAKPVRFVGVPGDRHRHARAVIAAKLVVA
jgi:hypothetical protein